MSAKRVVIAAAVLGCALGTAARAQMMGPGMAGPGFGGQQVPPCVANFVPLREEAQKRGLAIKTAVEKKTGREEICTLFKRFAEAEAKVVKYVKANMTECGIPEQAAKDMQANHNKTLSMRQKVCSAAPEGAEGAAVRPSGPGLSEALGTQRLQLDVPASGRGTFDTLSGNALKR